MEMIHSVKIGRIVVEAHPHYAYWLELEHTFSKGDILTTHMTDPAPDKDIYVVNEIIDKHTITVNRAISMPIGKHLRKLTTVDELMSKVDGDTMKQALHEQEIREQMHQLYINNRLKGKIEDKILDGYLYTISHEDLTLSLEDRKLARVPSGQRNVMVSTGRAGIMTYVEMARKDGLPDDIIAQSIWIEMVVHGVRIHVNIANLKVNEKEDEPQGGTEIQGS